MFSFFKKKAPPPEAPPAPSSPPALDEAAPDPTRQPATLAPPIDAPYVPLPAAPQAVDTASTVEAEPSPAEPARRSWFDRFRRSAPSTDAAAAPQSEATPTVEGSPIIEPPAEPVAEPVAERQAEPKSERRAEPQLQPGAEPERQSERERPKETRSTEARPAAPAPRAPIVEPIAPSQRASTAEPSPAAPQREAAVEPSPAPPPEAAAEARRPWLDRLKLGLRRTGSGIAQVFTGTRIDDALYEELESALLMADAGVQATEHLLADLKRRVKESRASEPATVKALLADAVAALLAPLEKPLVIGEAEPTVIMVAGVNGAGKTTTIGKLTRHLAESKVKVLLAAADTFRAAAREQLAVWADRNRVEIVSQQGGDPAAVSFDAVKAGQARGCEVVIADTAGRLPTQLHLMDELKKIQRTIGKAMAGAPHEVLLVVDGNTGQNALAQVKAFDAALGLTGLIVTKLDGTAKGGVLAAIALWSRERERQGSRPVPVYFVGVGERLEDLQTFSAREFAQALLG